MKTLCIYHGNCADGFGAAWAVRAALGAENVEFHAGVYQNPPPDVSGRDVILVDFSYKRPVLEQWNRLASWGSSRFVAFYADGDGNFHPKATIEKPAKFRELTDEMRKAALKLTSEAVSQLYLIDFDPIAWRLRASV